MKRIYYTSGSLLTGDRTADAVVSYAEALAVHESSATIDIPVTLQDGTLARAQLLIGPASQLVVVPEPVVGNAPDEPEDDELISRLTQQTVELSSPRPQAIDEETFGAFLPVNEYDEAIEEMGTDRLA